MRIVRPTRQWTGLVLLAFAAGIIAITYALLSFTGSEEEQSAGAEANVSPPEAEDRRDDDEDGPTQRYIEDRAAAEAQRLAEAQEEGDTAVNPIVGPDTDDRVDELFGEDNDAGQQLGGPDEWAETAEQLLAAQRDAQDESGQSDRNANAQDFLSATEDMLAAMDERDNNRRDSQGRQRELTEAARDAVQSQIDQINSTPSTGTRGSMTTTRFESPESTTDESADTVAAGGDGESASAAEEENPLGLHTGDVLYGVNLLEVNSDSSSRVMAEVAAGDYRGARLLGEFQRESTWLTVEFSRMRFEDEVYDVNIVAFDPDVPRSAVRSHVDTHFFERWAAFVGASFIGGFGEAVADTGGQIESTQSGTIRFNPERTLAQQLWIAGGETGSRVADVLAEGVDRPPTVTLDANEPIGLLVVDGA